MAEAHGTMNNILTTYYWSTLAADVHDFISKCPVCYIKSDRYGTRSRTAITPLTTPLRPKFCVYCDLVVLLKSVTEHKYVLSIIDALTKYTVLVPIINKVAKEVVFANVNNTILPIGPMTHLWLDQGSELTAKV